MRKEMDIRIQEAYRTPNRINPKNHTGRHYNKKKGGWEERDDIFKVLKEKKKAVNQEYVSSKAIFQK